MLSCSALGDKHPLLTNVWGRLAADLSPSLPTHRVTLTLHVLASAKDLLRNCCMILSSLVTRTTNSLQSRTQSSVQYASDRLELPEGLARLRSSRFCFFPALSRDRLRNQAVSCFWLRLTPRLDWPTCAAPVPKKTPVLQTLLRMDLRVLEPIMVFAANSRRLRSASEIN